MSKRVKVTIQDPSTFATGTAALFDGKLGTVETEKPVNSMGCGGMLVRFDSPAISDWPHRNYEITHFWFHPCDVTEVTS